MALLALAVAVAVLIRLALVNSRLRELTEGIDFIERAAFPLPSAQCAPPQPQPETPPVVAPAPESEIPIAVEVPAPSTEPERFAPPLPETPLEPPMSLADRFRSWLAATELEALVGGSILNKLGATVLVMGIALFLGYSFARMEPASRALLSICLSSALLIAGVLTERRARYRIFARGLIGAGWAALYATSYAIWAISAALLIANPIAGSTLTLLTAVAMVWHSLRYQSQAVTSVAYFAAFAALGVTPSTPFATLALIPLSASLLYLARRFDWYTMAWFGMVATYLTCVSRGASDAPLAATMTLFIAYWALFECFDLLRVARRISGGWIESIFLLNAAGFLSLTFFAWHTNAPERLWLAAAIAAGLYLASAVTRAFIRPPRSFSPADGLAARLAAGSFEGALIISAVLGGVAIAGGVPGIWISFGLALEAELLYLAGVKFDSRFLRRLGGRAFVFSLARVFLFDLPAYRQSNVLGLTVHNWSPFILMHVAAFYANRAFAAGSPIFGYAASALFAVVLGAELPDRFIGPAWLALAAALFEAGYRRRLPEFRLQAYALAAFGAFASAVLHGAAAGARSWIPLLVAVSLCYGLALRTRFNRAAVLGEEEKRWLAWSSAAAVSLLSALLVWRLVPGRHLGLAWALLAIAHFEFGARRLTPELRAFSYPVLLLAGVTVFFMHPIHQQAAFESWGAWVAMVVAALWFVLRLSVRPPHDTTTDERSAVRDLIAVYSVAASMAVIWMITPAPAITVAWCALALVSVELGVRLGLDAIRWAGNIVMVAALLQLFNQNLSDEFRLGLASRRVLTVLPGIAAFYWLARRMAGSTWSSVHLWLGTLVSMFLLERELCCMADASAWALFALGLLVIGVRKDSIHLQAQSSLAALAAVLWLTIRVTVGAGLPEPATVRWIAAAVAVTALYGCQFVARRLPERVAWYFSGLAAGLTSFTLFREVSGGLLTVALGLQGLVLLVTGFPLCQRILRLEGLTLLLFCILKLFVYDLRNLETVHRILSFISLGVILLAVSWAYARFRERIRKYL